MATRRVPMWPVAVALAGVGAIILVPEGSAGEGISAALQLLLNGLVGLLAARAASRSEGRLRLAWRLVAAASWSVVVALVVIVAWTVMGGALPVNEDLWWLFVLVNGLAFLGLLLLSPPEIQRASALRFALDALIVGTAILFVLMAAVEQWQPGSPGVGLFDLAYPAIDAAALTLILLVVSRRRGHVPDWYLLVAGAFLLVLATDTATTAWPTLPVWVTDGGYFLQLGLVGSAALAAAPWPPTTASPERLATQWAVYVPFGMAILAAMYDYNENEGLVQPLFFMAIVAVSLVVARTVVLLGENDRLARRLRETADFKTQLLRFISHEVANPLSPLRLQAHMLRDGTAKDTARAWATLDRSIARLESLSRDVRMMALAETHRLVNDLVPTDLAPRVQAAVAAHHALAERRGLQLAAEVEPVTVPVDAERFDQVVDNLLSNALKFTARGGRIDVRLHAGVAGAVLEVADSGAGLTPEQRDRLFTAFGRAHGDAQPGLGLGLYLCKSIVDGHGGRITAQSDGPGKGALFRVTLPAAPATPSAPLPPRPRYVEPVAAADPPAP